MGPPLEKTARHRGRGKPEQQRQHSGEHAKQDHFAAPACDPRRRIIGLDRGCERGKHRAIAIRAPVDALDRVEE